MCARRRNAERRGVTMTNPLLKSVLSGHKALSARETRKCPMVRYRAAWCRGLCRPLDGKGQCGHPAPHAMMGRTQQAIARSRSEVKEPRGPER